MEVCEPSKVISLSLDFSFAGGDDLGAGSGDGTQIGDVAIQRFTNRGHRSPRQNPLCASSIWGERALIDLRVSRKG